MKYNEPEGLVKKIEISGTDVITIKVITNPVTEKKEFLIIHEIRDGILNLNEKNFAIITDNVVIDGIKFVPFSY